MSNHTHHFDTTGERYKDFIITRILPIPELNCTLKELEHLPSGASIMHIANDDPENLFCLSFKTLPHSSNGAPHILEHTVLCGSKKFPVKDPFFSMSRRSLNTFMNALTGADFTCYPAASLNEKDFYNLLDVYLDAVFHPELKLMSFLQEGHRLEFASPKDPTTPLEHRGIVFNEMKGNLSSADTRLWHAMMAEIVPDLPYCFNSGGDPKEIPSLTYEELIAFHDTYYHPSRCLFFFYGNFPLKQHLDFISEKALKSIAKQPPLPSLPLQKRFSEPVYKKIRYPVSEQDSTTERSIVAFGFLTCPLLNQEEVLALCVLDSVLMETDASLLKQPLLRSKLCIHADAYMDTEMSEVPYLIVCKGCEEKNADAIQTLLWESLKEIAENAIPEELIDAAVHQLELSRSEITGDQSPFGLTLFMRSALAKQHGCSPENALTLHTLFEKLLQKIKDPSYIKDLLNRYFIDNPHFVRLIMQPDPNLSSEEIAIEKKALEQLQKELSENQIQTILQQTQQLSEFQKNTEGQSLECLPKVTLNDVSPNARDFLLKKTSVKNLEVFHHPCFTNHILYADLCFDLPQIDEADLPFVQLLTSILPEIGSANRSYTENLEYMHAYTGGISTSCALHVQATDPQKADPAFGIRGKALYRNAEKLFTLIKDTLIHPRFDEQSRIQELILQLRESQLNRLNRQAMRYAVQLCLSGFSPTTHINEAWHGLRYFKTIEEIAQNISSNLSEVVDKLVHLHKQLITFHKPHLILSCSKEMKEELQSQDFYGLLDLPIHTSFTPWQMDFPLSKVSSQGRVIASQVAFNAEAFKTIPYLHPHAPALTVAALLFDNKVLHRKIREQGGAYGCGATYNTTLGLIYFHSYRDPHISLTLNAFKTSVEEIAAGHFTSQDLEEAKLGIIQQLDSPISPGSRAMVAYGCYRDQKTLALRQQFRERLLALTPQEIQQVVKLELLDQMDKGITVSFAGKELLEKEKALLETQKKHFPLFSI